MIRLDERAQVISLNTSGMDIRYLKQHIEDKIQHSFLERYINKPVINEDKLRLLVEIITNTKLPDYKKERYIVTTMLVQIALDTHDYVPSNTDENENKEIKLNKQLHVLAGDYYSGLYYFLLSEIDDFDFIHQLATAIKEINEQKMKLYYNEVSSFEDYLQLFQRIDALLIIHVASYLHVTILGKVAEQWLFVTKLNVERQRLSETGYPLISINGFGNESATVVKISQLNTLLNKAINHLKEDLNKVNKDNTGLIQYIHHQLPINTSNVEEG